MTAYAGLLQQMMQAVRGNGSAEHLLKDRPDFPASEQLGIYSKGYRIRLRDVLEGAYPALTALLGAQAFQRLAEGFTQAHSSRTFNIDRYPVAFGAYVAGQTEDVFARDLAQLESAIHDVYQREETPALEAAWAARQTPESLSGAVFSLRTASALLALQTPADDYLSAFRSGRNPARPADEKTWLLVLRHRNQVQRLPLAQAEYTLLTLLAKGLTLAAALEDAQMQSFIQAEDFSAPLQEWFARWVKEGVFIQP